ncbi:hypothetical protein EON65_38505 [archaeon]|nr:MAG: hypothetical protein EON65_38505 [archaeon]
MISSTSSTATFMHSTSLAGSRGMHIQVEDLYYSVELGRNPPSRKVILKGLSFQLLPGSLCALMGPSGSGKR